MPEPNIPVGFKRRFVLRGHKAWINRIAWSPDGSLLASASGDRTIKLWDVKTGSIVHTFEGHAEWVYSAAWSPDGQLIASCSADHSVRTWQVQTGTQRQAFLAHYEPVYDVAWSPTGDFLASASRDQSVLIWDWEKNIVHCKLTGHTQGVNAIAWSPDAQLLATGSHDHTIRIWEAHSGRLIRVLAGKAGTIASLIWSRDGKLLVAGCSDSTIRLWDPSIGTLVKTLVGHTSVITSCSLSPDGLFLASKSWDGTTRIWRQDSPDTWATVALLEAPVSGNWAPGVAFSPRYPEFASLQEGDTSICIWDLDMDVLRRRAPILKPALPLSSGEVRILHLSDIHLGTVSEARRYRVQVVTDLTQELGIGRLSYLVVSGDIATRSTPEDYSAACELTQGIMTRFEIDSGRIIITPGNHDLNWEIAEDAYPFVLKRRLSSSLPEGRYIPAGESGVLLRDEDRYQRRFDHFNTYYHKQIYNGAEYPREYSEQGILYLYPADRILFLSLNSAWEIDHHFRDRASINMEALSRALDQLQDGQYEEWLKIAVFHHPVTGREAMNDDFMQLLAVHGFQIVLHGHVHEAKEGFYKYDDKRGIHIIGAGTFGAPTREQVPGIPLQYNLLTFDPATRKLTVETRKKEKPDGAWMADARWGDKNNPSPRYTIQLR